ncbi:hypothetical protein [Deinococcus hopiensis]|uniref:Uncharacterized protein n=1 Tax=Deinococcus hopiensis KR-140 TaxID=695939 RepID=A0A1W1UJ75_9DEIO|nr:hypothetical protein [Deinococcus hopiensis]SMB81092.1 hypothetical protein SAMN00790413_04459 [Deinococcus hopiensis KR-140]
MMTITRLHRYVLGLTVPPSRPHPEEVESLEEIVLHSPARSVLRAQLSAPGVLRGGLLFGHIEGSRLHVLYAAPQGYRGWPSLTSPLAIDPRYALGWADALTAISSRSLEWVGSWLMYPDSERDVPEQDLRWLRWGQRAGILDDQTVLLCVGWQDGAMVSTGYRLLDSEVTCLRVEGGNKHAHPEGEDGA